ncbi:hypothetical protein OG21DRAFT_363609 [Imleria badia]|nr:hypothetical protein OG21DRAFT_363609 [Imleria badia]
MTRLYELGSAMGRQGPCWAVYLSLLTFGSGHYREGRSVFALTMLEPGGHRDRLMREVTNICTPKQRWDSNLDVQQSIRSTSSKEKIRALNVSPDSYIDGGKRIKRQRGHWDITSGKCLVGPLAAHSRQARCIQFPPQGDWFGTVANSESSLLIWNSLTGNFLFDVTLSNPRALV